jgi:SAM-dependent methyltransferase
MTAPNLICPEDGTALRQPDGVQTVCGSQILASRVMCERGHVYPVVEGIPVLLRADVPATLDVSSLSLQCARTGDGAPLFLDTLGLSREEKAQVAQAYARGSVRPDPVISWLIGATSGSVYAPKIGRLAVYPVPEIPLRHGDGRWLLDIGCNWGRWSIAAARKGWKVVGVDPSLGALLAAQRLARELGVEVSFVCADARYLPLTADSLDQVFSYSVLQHFSYEDAALAFREAARVVKPGGKVKIQMAQRFGGRSLYQQARRGFRAAEAFEVRYWSISTLRHAFKRSIGSPRIRAEAFGGLGLLFCDIEHLSPKHRALVAFSECLRRLGTLVPSLAWIADSVYVEAAKEIGASHGVSP